jgi:hypothetical protein
MIMANFSDKDWTFLVPQNIAVFTTGQVIAAKEPILYVCHDDEGEWQFHTGTDVNMEDARVVALGEIVKRDPSIFDLADLPTGWIATRRNQDDDWQRFKDVRITADL